MNIFRRYSRKKKSLSWEENSDSQALRLDEIEVHKEEVLALLESMKIDKSPDLS